MLEHLKMVRTIKRKWLTKLRSGEFKQGRNNLRSTNDTYCCLGVLLCVVNNKGWTLRESDSFGEPNRWHHRRQEPNDDFLSKNLLKELKISVDDQQTLASMNDSGESFNVIANWIEKNL